MKDETPKDSEDRQAIIRKKLLALLDESLEQEGTLKDTGFRVFDTHEEAVEYIRQKKLSLIPVFKRQGKEENCTKQRRSELKMKKNEEEDKRAKARKELMALYDEQFGHEEGTLKGAGISVFHSYEEVLEHRQQKKAEWKRRVQEAEARIKQREAAKAQVQNEEDKDERQ